MNLSSLPLLTRRLRPLRAAALLSLLAGPAAAQLDHYGAPCAGASGAIPTLELDGYLQQGAPITITAKGTPLDAGIFALGVQKVAPGLPLDAYQLPGCELLLLPLTNLPFSTDVDGQATFAFAGGPVGVPVHFQSWIFDAGPGSLGGMSDGMTVTILPTHVVGAGDLVVTEVHRSPSYGDATLGEWIEVLCDAPVPVDLEGFTLTDDGGEVHVIDVGGAGLVVEPGERVVLGASTDAIANGGAPVAYAWSGFLLDDAADEVVLTDPLGVEVDRVAYGSGGAWPVVVPGRSLALSSDASTAADNDLPSNWCYSTSAAGWSGPSTDLASPGLANSACACIGTDLPDAGYVDSNCDGIDGAVDRAVFVAKGGSDANLGTIDAPVLSIQRAIDLAAADPARDHVYVSVGTYVEQLHLADGVSIWGGYDADDFWSRSTGNAVEVVHGAATQAQVVETVIASEATQKIVLGDLTVRSVTAASVQTETRTQIALRATDSFLVELQRVRLFADPGANGRQGAPGVLGTESFGGSGGNGSEPFFNGKDGTAGGGASGGSGGAGGSYPGQGKDGKDGGDGAIGANGSPATSSLPLILAGEWVVASASKGMNGTSGGKGGGGGGGGGGSGGIVFGSGDKGGVGGKGGAYGGGGQGGWPGGSSVGLLASGSTVVLLGSEIAVGDGGHGGGGGSGHAGGAGNAGGAPTGGTTGGFTGGDGGRGGDGGKGGRGGAGAGGCSFCWVSVDGASFFNDSYSFQHMTWGAAGFGGSPGGPAPAGIADRGYYVP